MSSYPLIIALEHVTVVDATAGVKTITFEQGAFEISGQITNSDAHALTLQHRPSEEVPPAAVTLPTGVGYSRLFKSSNKHVVVADELAITVPEGAIAVFQCEGFSGYPEPTVV